MTHRIRTLSIIIASCITSAAFSQPPAGMSSPDMQKMMQGVHAMQTCMTTSIIG